jgi:RNA polymerase sigma-70 factor (ECF subfamily)
LRIQSLLNEPKTFDKGFNLLVESYKERLYWAIRRIVLLHELADDVLQNTFIKVFKNIHNFKAESQLLTWLHRIAINEALTAVEREKKHRQLVDIDDVPVISINQLTADVYFDSTAADAILFQAMSTLPEKQRTVFTLRYFEEMPYADMATVLNTSVGALKSSYHIAVNKIESYINTHKSVS